MPVLPWRPWDGGRGEVGQAGEPRDRLFASGHGHRRDRRVLELDGVGVPGVAPVNLVLTLFVDDAQAAHDQLQRAGAEIARGLEDTPWGHRSFGVDDPDGLRIWVVEVLPGD